MDCVWGIWKYGECTKECGVGTRKITRNVLVKDTQGGKQCSGPSTVTESCNLQKCTITGTKELVQMKR